MIKLFFAFLFLVLSILVLNPRIIQGTEPPSPNSYKINLPNGLTIEAEIAMDKQKGLQERKKLCSSCGMIFIFDGEGYYPFWMKDTFIDLAMLWINSDGKIVHIVRDAKPCVGKQNPYTECRIYAPSSLAKYVLEVNPKAANGIELGMKVKSNPPF